MTRSQCDCPRCTYPVSPESPPWGGKFSRRGLRQACEAAGVKRPIRLRYGMGERNTRTRKAIGVCSYRAEADDYQVRLTTDMSAKAANRVALHEIRHAGQRDSYPDPDQFDVDSYLSEAFDGYEESFHERDANDFARRNEHIQVVVA